MTPAKASKESTRMLPGTKSADTPDEAFAKPHCVGATTFRKPTRAALQQWEELAPRPAQALAGAGPVHARSAPARPDGAIKLFTPCLMVALSACLTLLITLPAVIDPAALRPAGGLVEQWRDLNSRCQPSQDANMEIVCKNLRDLALQRFKEPVLIDNRDLVVDGNLAYQLGGELAKMLGVSGDGLFFSFFMLSLLLVVAQTRWCKRR